MISQTLHNRYTISAQLGKGAMGTVYLATDSQTGQKVAIKVVARELASDDSMLERFKREGEALRQLKHPNIVGFADAFQFEGQYIIVMEYVSGGSLHSLIRQGPLPIERARQIALDLCDALIRAHRLNIVHRDLKPENILIAEDGTPRLTDFGVAKLVEGSRMTRTGTQVGTPYYMSPEAWEGKPLDSQADIWSLGVVVYEMLSGEVPFGGETMAAVMNRVLTTRLPDIKTRRPDVPGDLASIINRMLTRSKDKRYHTMREVALDLERGQLRATPQPTVVAPGKPTAAPRWLWAVGVGVGIVLCVGVLLGGGIVTAGVLGQQASRQQTQAAILLSTGDGTEPPANVTATPRISRLITATSSSARTATPEPPGQTAPNTGPTVADRWDFVFSTGGWSQVDVFTPDAERERVEDGMFVTRSFSSNPFLFSPTGLEIEAAVTSVIEFRMLVSQGGTGRMYFTTEAEPDFNEQNLVRFALSPGEFHTYELQMTIRSGWEGTVTRLRLIPTEFADSDIQIDYIVIRSP